MTTERISQERVQQIANGDIAEILVDPQVKIFEIFDLAKDLLDAREAARRARQRPLRQGCVCPGDATPLCQNQLCPRKPIPGLLMQGPMS